MKIVLAVVWLRPYGRYFIIRTCIIQIWQTFCFR